MKLREARLTMNNFRRISLDFQGEATALIGLRGTEKSWETCLAVLGHNSRCGSFSGCWLYRLFLTSTSGKHLQFWPKVGETQGWQNATLWKPLVLYFHKFTKVDSTWFKPLMGFLHSFNSHTATPHLYVILWFIFQAWPLKSILQILQITDVQIWFVKLKKTLLESIRYESSQHQIHSNNLPSTWTNSSVNLSRNPGRGAATSAGGGAIAPGEAQGGGDGRRLDGRKDS